MRFRKFGSLPSKVDGQMQMKFFRNELQPRLDRLEQANAGERYVYFMDASNLLFGGYPDYCWYRERQWVRTSSGRRRLNNPGAVNAASSKMARREVEVSVNAETVYSLLIDQNKTHEGSDAAITFALDNVPYQRVRMVRKLSRALKLELLLLSPYSQNLNLVERARKHIKKRCLSNRFYKTCGQFRESI